MPLILSRLANFAVLCLVLVLYVGIAQAQTALKWNEDRLTWTAPTACADGSPIAQCAVTGYSIETARSATATSWTLVTTVASTVTTHLVSGVSAGDNCYRVLATSANGNSVPSNVSCATAIAPPPAPPVLQAVDTVAYEIKRNSTGTLVATRIGLVPMGTVCAPENQQKVGTATYSLVPRQSVDVVNWPSNMKIENVYARCGI